MIWAYQRRTTVHINYSKLASGEEVTSCDMGLSEENHRTYKLQ